MIVTSNRGFVNVKCQSSNTKRSDRWRSKRENLRFFGIRLRMTGFIQTRIMQQQAAALHSQELRFFGFRLRMTNLREKRNR